MPEPLATQVLRDGFGRVAEALPEVVSGLSADDLRWRPAPGANPIGWLVWHLSRVEDDHLAGVAGSEQVWVGGWYERFALPYPIKAHGYGHSDADVDAFSVGSPELLADYYSAVHSRTVAILDGLSESDYARVVDTNWTPHVTAAVRLVSVLNDVTQHLGQAAYVRGMLERR